MRHITSSQAAIPARLAAARRLPARRWLGPRWLVVGRPAWCCSVLSRLFPWRHSTALQLSASPGAVGYRLQENWTRNVGLSCSGEKWHSGILLRCGRSVSRSYFSRPFPAAARSGVPPRRPPGAPTPPARRAAAPGPPGCVPVSRTRSARLRRSRGANLSQVPRIIRGKSKCNARKRRCAFSRPAVPLWEIGTRSGRALSREGATYSHAGRDLAGNA